LWRDGGRGPDGGLDGEVASVAVAVDSQALEGSFWLKEDG